MTAEDELIQLREVKRLLHEQVSLQKQVIARQQEHIRLLEQQVAQQQEQSGLLVKENSLLAQRVSQLTHEVKHLTEQVTTLQEPLAKDSHNSHLPPSSDRFARQPRSLRKQSGKKSGGQAGHRGQSLSFSATPDEIVVHAMHRCQHCQTDLGAVAATIIERRQVVEVSLPRVLVREHQAEQKQCPVCQQPTRASFPVEVRAPVQSGSSIGAIAVYLVQQQLLPWARACEVMEDLLGVSMSAFAATCLPCANRTSLCFRLCRPLCLVIPSFLHLRLPE